MVPEVVGGDVWDVAVRYAGERGAFKMTAAAAYSNAGTADIYDGSVSVLHVPTGISLTGAGGYNAGDDGVDGRYLYGKLGYQRALFGAGSTAFAIDIYGGDDINTAGCRE